MMTGVTETYPVPVARSNHPLLMLEEISDVTGNDLWMTGVTEMYPVPVVRSNHPLLMLEEISDVTGNDLFQWSGLIILCSCQQINIHLHRPS